jgi:DNA-binding NtrC family response regulator
MFRKSPLKTNTRLRLLIVDDEPSIRTLLAQVLTRSGYRVQTCAGGLSALSTIRQEIPDILLSDLKMPGMSGFELLAIVRQLFPGIKTIAMSGAYSVNEIPGIVADAFYDKGSDLNVLDQILDAIAVSPGRA